MAARKRQNITSVGRASAGVYPAGTTTLLGGEISENHGMIAGGIFVRGTLNVRGGKICDNTSREHDGDASEAFAHGMLIGNWGKINLSGSPEIAATDDND